MFWGSEISTMIIHWTVCCLWQLKCNSHCSLPTFQQCKPPPTLLASFYIPKVFILLRTLHERFIYTHAKLSPNHLCSSNVTASHLPFTCLTGVIDKATANHQYCRATCLDISQAFDKVWHPGLLLKIKSILHSSYLNLLKSYLNERQFETKIIGETSSRFHNYYGLPQGSILGPLFYVLYTSDLPTSKETTLDTSADETEIFATHEDPTIASHNLQST